MRNKAFTLLEIMIVVAIVVALITLAVPNILRSRIIANETAAIGNLKVLDKACQLYHMDNRTYPEALADLKDAQPPYLDSVLASGTRQGYEFVYTRVSQDSFKINANSTSTGLLRGRYFYMDESGIIRANSEAEAGPDDEIVK